MEIIIVTLKELLKGNKRSCISPLRATNNCVKCKYYDACESRRMNKAKHDLREELLKQESEAKERLKHVKNKLEELYNGGTAIHKD